MSAQNEKYEKKDISFGAVIGWTVALLVLLGFAYEVSIHMHRHFLQARATENIPMSPLAQMHRVPPEPRLQVSPPVDLVRLHDIEDGRLHTYGWVDPQAGVVRIPIERAMKLIAERGDHR